ncbi:MAG: hypothetical protein LIP11_14700 [Clostridiales bacterium]|nr:hypothetical protein [Clostridiales bacterium]
MTIKAIPKTEKYRQQRKEQKKRYYAKTANLYPARPWTEEETRMVMDHRIPDSELSVLIRRSMKSIQEKRRREKKNE